MKICYLEYTAATYFDRPGSPAFQEVMKQMVINGRIILDESPVLVRYHYRLNSRKIVLDVLLANLYGWLESWKQRYEKKRERNPVRKLSKIPELTFYYSVDLFLLMQGRERFWPAVSVAAMRIPRPGPNGPIKQVV